MTATSLHRIHPVSECVQVLSGALSAVAGADPVWMSVEAKREALVSLDRLGAQLEALRMSVMAVSGDVAEIDGCRSVAAWLAPRTLSSPGADHRAERLGRDLTHRWRRVGYALSEGMVSLAQAEVIARALDNLGDEVEPALMLKAEEHLLELAEDFGPKQLRALGDAILERIAPEQYDDQERKKLLEAERRANAATRMSFRNRGDGATDINIRLPEAFAARLKQYLHAWTSPRHDSQAGSPNLDPTTGRRLPHDRILGNAFCSMLEAIDPKVMPAKAGAPTTVVITMPLADLRQGIGVGTLSDGTRISAGEVRRLACNAGIIPAVLGGRSEVLDLGRVKRFFSGKQKLAMSLEDPYCRADGCTVPSDWCEAHHFEELWSQGGKTDLKDGKLLCS